MLSDLYTTRLQESIRVLQACSTDEFMELTQQMADVIIDCLQRGSTVLFCGNGGSAADAQHLATELSGRFYIDREAHAALTLGCNPAFMTAIGNDYSFESTFAREIQAIGRKGDVLVAISTSGNSPNVLKGIEEARKRGIYIIGFTGKTGGAMASLCDLCLNVPSQDVPRIQEAHKVIGHTLCEYIEKTLA